MSAAQHLHHRSSSPNAANQSKYKGVRRRKWGKWISEIRVPNTRERLWLGTYSTPEAAAVAFDLASYCLRGGEQFTSLNGRLNFPLVLPSHVRDNMSPKSIQKAASNAGMAIDAHMILNMTRSSSNESRRNEGGSDSSVDVGLSEVEINWENVCSCGSCEGTQTKYDRESLNISVEDYL